MSLYLSLPPSPYMSLWGGGSVSAGQGGAVWAFDLGSLCRECIFIYVMLATQIDIG